MNADWTPDQLLRADATDEQINARRHHVPGDTLGEEVAAVAREYADACVEAKRREWLSPAHILSTRAASVPSAGGGSVTKEMVERAYQAAIGYTTEAGTLYTTRDVMRVALTAALAALPASAHPGVAEPREGNPTNG